MTDPLAAALTELERRIQEALHTADRSRIGGMEILGYGDSSLVLACDTPAGRLALKRLPPFPSLIEIRAYGELIVRYAEALRERGVTVLETRLEPVRRPDGGWTAYCVQRAIEPQALLKNVLLRCTEEEAQARLDQLLDLVLTAVTERVGIDADVSNWCVLDGEPVFFDMTTPMLRDERLRDEADYSPFLSSLPAFVRWFATSSTASSMLEKFYSPRAVVLDVLCGLLRERVGRVAHLMAQANRRLARPISPGELRRYFLVNQSTWAVFRKLQRLERWWSVSVRRRPYPFLLPPASAFAGHLAAAPLFKAGLD